MKSRLSEAERGNGGSSRAAQQVKGSGVVAAVAQAGTLALELLQAVGTHPQTPLPKKGKRKEKEMRVKSLGEYMVFFFHFPKSKEGRDSMSLLSQKGGQITGAGADSTKSLT